MARPFDGCYLPQGDAHTPPAVDGNRWLVNGEIRVWGGKSATVRSPVMYQGTDEALAMGTYAMLTAAEAVQAAEAAAKAFDNGRGAWPLMPVKERLACVQKYLEGLKQKKREIVGLIEWEICKPSSAAEKEVDRTVEYIDATLRECKDMANSESTFRRVEGVAAQVRRAPYGVVLCCGPFNYPFNETYTVLIPAILMGNTVVMKLPRSGVLCHFPTLELFRDCFPPGVVNIVSGSGRETLPAIMSSGLVDIFAFIGTSQAASALQKAHPHPNRLRVVLGLEAKNPGIVMADADIAVAVAECILGAFSYNGQRCTAIKILFVDRTVLPAFSEQFSRAADALKMGLPWGAGVAITPLPEEGKPGYMKKLIEDAVAKGAQVINPRGGQVDRTFVSPTVVAPVTPDMLIYREEQFGPVVPIVPFDRIEEVYDYMATSPYGQQAAVFTTNRDGQLGHVIDVLTNQVSRVNINAQCQRGPDVFPFTGRKDSAYGTLSVYDALRTFSIRSMVATKDTPENNAIVSDVVQSHSSRFLRMEYIF